MNGVHAIFVDGKQSRSQTKTKAMGTRERNIHIGHLIHEQLKKDQRSVSWLAREIHCTRNNLYKIFNKASLDSDLILKISRAMQFNFFQYYTAEFLQGMKERVGESA